MSSQRIPEIKIEKVKKSTRIAVVTAIWNQDLTDKMLEECLKTLKEFGLKVIVTDQGLDNWVKKNLELTCGTK